MRRPVAPILWLALAVAAWPAQWAPTTIGGGCCPGGSCPAPSRPLQIQKYSQVVEVVADDGGGVASRGTGVIISRAEGRAYVATVQHTLRDRAGEVTVMVGGKSYTAEVLGEDAQADAAVLSIPDPGITTLAIGPVPAFGAKTWAGGFARRTLSWVGGVVRSMVDGQHLVVSGGSRQGWSGGPVIDSQGRVVAILHATDGRQTYATPLAVYRRLFWRVVPLWWQEGQYGTHPSPKQPIPDQPTPDDGDLQAILTLIDELQTEVKSLQAAVESLAAQQPAVGPPGLQGPRGPPGELATVDLDELTEKVIERLPPMRFQAKNPDGTLRGPLVEKRLGGKPLYLKSVPVE